jgi:branched-chain amino acid transport system ATP-binding protein
MGSEQKVPEAGLGSQVDVLSVADLTIDYSGVPAVRSLSFRVGHAEIVAIVGPNGAGKSTTLKAVMGLVRPSAGDIHLGGQSVVDWRPEEIARAGVGYVPEGRGIFADLTVMENLRLGMTGRRQRRSSSPYLASALELFPVLSTFSNRTAGHLSGGQQQMLAIARALAGGPRLLVLDEPSLGLAPLVIDQVFEACAEIRGRGCSILIVEQRAHRTIAFADRTHVMSGGVTRLVMGPEHAGDTERLSEAYFG